MPRLPTHAARNAPDGRRARTLLSYTQGRRRVPRARQDPRALSQGEATLELPPAVMRRLGHRAVDLVVRHLSGLRRAPIGLTGTRRQMRALLEEPPPQRGRPWEAVLERCARQVFRHTLQPHHPRFFAFIPSCPAYPGVVADLLSAGFSVFAGTWLEASGPAQVELTVLDWFRRWLAMPAQAGGVMVSGGSVANLTALAAARETLPGGWSRRERASPVLYVSDQGHSSVERAARVLGLAAGQIRPIATDARFRMSVQELEAAIALDRRRGLRPWCVVANAGSTNTGSIDPLPRLVRLCRRERMWLHVDAAYGGFAALSRRGRGLLRGLGGADSVTLDPHKWLYAPFDIGCLMVRDRRRLRRAFAMHAEYLQDIQASKEEINFCDYGIQLTRSFRALKVWLTVQIYGARRIAAVIDRCLDLAHRAAGRLASSPAFEILSPPSLGIVCFRYLPASLRAGFAARSPARSSRDPSRAQLRPSAEQALLRRVNEEIVRRVRERGRSFFSSTVLDGRYALRLCILGHRTLRSDVEEVLDEIEATGARVRI